MSLSGSRVFFLLTLTLNLIILVICNMATTRAQALGKGKGIAKGVKPPPPKTMKPKSTKATAPKTKKTATPKTSTAAAKDCEWGVCWGPPNMPFLGVARKAKQYHEELGEISARLAADDTGAFFQIHLMLDQTMERLLAMQEEHQVIRSDL